ncbi:MAG: flagellin [Caulobacterales bacterium]
MALTLNTLRFNTQAQLDVGRIMRELTDLQRQVASAVKSNELAGYGVGASRLLNTQSLVGVTDARANAASQLQSRFGVQASALGQASSSAFNLSQAISDAIAGDNVNALGTELTINFAAAVSALNETWNGQPLFAGERLTGSPVKIGSLAELVAATGPDDIFDEAERAQTIDLGPGARLTLADKASDLSYDLFNTMRDFKLIIDGWGSSPPTSLSQAQKDELQAIGKRLDASRVTLTAAEGSTGQLETRIVAERTRLQSRSTLLQKEVGELSDADPAQLSIQISTLLSQYQATAKTFADIANLSLLDYL